MIDQIFQNSSWTTIKQLKLQAQKQQKNQQSIDQKTNKPCKRWGHTMIQNENFLYLFGGAGSPCNPQNIQSTYIYNLQTYKWKALQILGPEPRDSHAACKNKNLMFIFGGHANNKSLNDFWQFDFNNLFWVQIHPEGKIPGKREGHIMETINENKIFIFGGCEQTNIYNDSYIYEKRQNTFYQINCQYSPQGRESISSCCVNNEIYIFGGQGIQINQQEKYYNDLYKFSQTEQNVGNWQQIIPQSSQEPPARSSSSMKVYADRYIFLIGGEGYSSQLDETFPINQNSSISSDNVQSFPKNDVWVYDLQINLWFQLETKNHHIFTPRFTHSSCIYQQSIIIFGGLKDYKSPLDEMIVLQIQGNQELIDERNNLIKYCGVCEQLINSSLNQSQNQQKEVLKKIEIFQEQQLGYNFLYSLSQQIYHPFQAIKIIILEALNQQCSEINLNIDNNQIKIIEYFNQEIQLNYIFYVASLKLGQRIIMIQKYNDNVIIQTIEYMLNLLIKFIQKFDLQTLQQYRSKLFQSNNK